MAIIKIVVANPSALAVMLTVVLAVMLTVVLAVMLTV